MENKDKEYEEYVFEHTENVLKAYLEFGKDILRIMNNEGLDEKLFELVNNHDKSKLSKEEFEGYRKKFFPTKDEDKELADTYMDAAWLHHMNTNKHHPEYWIVREKQGFRPIDMGREYIAEMILDWIAMGYKFKANALQWFKQNEEYYKGIMSKATFYTTKKVVYQLFEGDK
jgi:hypothetical protein